MIRYAEATPETLDLSLAIQPWGALEWHGSHLPLGLDGLVAEAFALRLAEAEGGTLLPTQWSPMTTLPHQASLQLSTDAFRLLAEETIRELHRAGFARIALVSGHYAQGHMVELYELARRLSHDAGLAVYVATPLEPIGDPNLLDHAGQAEASQLLALRPDLVRLAELPDPGEPKRTAILGAHPGSATAEEGEELLRRGVEAWSHFLALPADALPAHYEAAIRQYDGYRESYFRESWEQAITDWWATK